MLIKPDIAYEDIIRCLRDAYGLKLEDVTFLPLGADPDTAVYRVKTSCREDYFLKLRRCDFNEASVLVPQHLADQGFQYVIPPLITEAGTLWTNLGSCKAVLYPYIEGRHSFDARLSDLQCIEFGAAMKRFHSTNFPKAIAHIVPKETVSPIWHESVKILLGRIDDEVFKEPIAADMADFLRSKSADILKYVCRAYHLALALQKQPLTHIICHTDIHGWNLSRMPERLVKKW